MKGRRPYLGKNRKEIRDAIFAKQICLRKADLPEGWSIEAADFINKTLQRKPCNRLGLNGPAEVKSHIWLKDIDWNALENKTLPAPYIPEERPPLANQKPDKESAEVGAANKALLKKEEIQNLWEGYEYDIE